MRIEQKSESGIAVLETKPVTAETQKSQSHHVNSGTSASLWFLVEPRYTATQKRSNPETHTPPC